MLLNVFESRCGGMVDTRHLKCRGRKPVPVQVRPAVITSSKKIEARFSREFVRLKDPKFW